MNIQTMAAIAEIIGAVAVLATLIYLAMQIRQNTHSIEQQNAIARAEILQQRADSVNGIVTPVLSNETNINLFVKLMESSELEPSELNKNERMRAYLMLTPVRANFENTYLQYQLGFLPEDFYRDVAVPNCIRFGALLLKFDLPMTSNFKAEIIRILAEYKKLSDV
ncbi:MAG: hypothetical protein KBT89_15815 [Gammaproteobacteria bacterium]|nr:hypothetical protein [Gammaproteobacteria bacterium]